jgi:subtilisin family serine protease
MNQLFRTLIASLAVCLAVPPGAGAAQSDPLHKEGRGKLSYELDRIARESERGGQVKSMSPAYNRAKGTVTVVIELNAGASTDAIQSVVRAAGGRVDGVAANLVKATMAPGVLRDVAAQPDVRLVRTPYRPTVKKAGRVGAARIGAARLDGVVSQGVGVIGADSYIARTGANGSGITVGVLDGAFEGAVNLVGSELPEDVSGTDFVLSHLDSPGTHGTACAEIVHDVAPGARIWLGAFEDEVGWSNQIDELVNVGGVRIISHSIGFDNLFPPDGNNFWSQKVDGTAARGVLFVTAAGNEGENYYQGRWSDVNHDGFLEFVGPGGATDMLQVYVGSGASLRLRWDDPYGRSNHDYDIALVTADFAGNPEWSESNPAVLAFSADTQNGAGNPLEVINFDYPDGELAYIVVRHDPASPESATQRMFFWNMQGIDPAFANASGTLSMPGDARGAVTVGAVGWDSRGLEGFSSRGPTADNRVKPDVVGPDRVVTVSFGDEFPGTSAATPHVAGAAALILSKSPSLSATALRQALERATTSNGSATAKNNDVGFGLIDLTRAP